MLLPFLAYAALVFYHSMFTPFYLHFFLLFLMFPDYNGNKKGLFSLFSEQPFVFKDLPKKTRKVWHF